jgi:hypothetical protein
MRKILAVAGSLLFFIGCVNDNQIKIENQAAGEVLFNFRAAIYTVPSGGVTVIKDIPNGTYIPDVSYGIPSGYTSGSLPSVTSLAFQKESTKWYLLFTSVIQSGTYNPYLNETTSDGGITITSP